MPCSGHCYDVGPWEAPSSSPQEDEEASLLPYHSDPLREYVYSPLSPAQTRILRLHAAGPTGEGDSRDSQLYADLITVNLHILDGVMIDGTTEIIDYKALSYCWGHPNLSEILICNGKAKWISRQNATALRVLRHPTTCTNLWLDALCINQDDKQEKSEQVAHMLAIYKKAQSVIAWLGDPDDHSLLAFACAKMLPSLENALFENRSSEHDSSCIDQLRRIYLALHFLFGRPWLSRTWIRQEIYGAKQITVQCGFDKISWEDFMRLAMMLSNVRKLVDDHRMIPKHQGIRIERLLREAQFNARVPLDGVKPPRDLIRVLAESKEFGYEDPRDTLYAILGMCDVKTRTRALHIDDTQTSDILVDYAKPLNEVYCDALLYVVSRQDNAHMLADLWHAYRRTISHSEGLATWAFDWLSDVQDGAYIDYIDRTLKSRSVARSSRSHSAGATLVPDCSGLQWVPLGGITNSKDNMDDDAWHWPEPLLEDRTVLRLKVRVLNYIAHLTDYTCDLVDFMENSDDYGVCRGGYGLGVANLAVHVDGVVRPHHTWFSRMPTDPIKFNPRLHKWRLAVLGVAHTEQLCLVPSSACKGDLVIAIAPGLLPTVIRPKGGGSTSGVLFKEASPSEALSRDVVQIPEPRTFFRMLPLLWYSILGMLTLSIFVFNICMLTTWTEHEYGLPLFACFGGAFGVLLLGHMACTHVYVHTPCSIFGARPFFFLRFVETVCVGSSTIWSLCVSIPLMNSSSQAAVIVLSVYLILPPIIVMFGFLWRFISPIYDEIPLTLRRETVLGLLDKITEITGQDYEFHGPMFVQASRVYPFFCSSGDAELSFLPLKLCFQFALFAHNRTKGRKYVAKGDHEQVYTQLRSYERDNIWCRPRQEIRLH